MHRIVVDAEGRQLMANLAAADLFDDAGARANPDAPVRSGPWMQRLFTDGAWDRGKQKNKTAFPDFTAEVVRRIGREPGFGILPQRSVVERPFAWMTCRRAQSDVSMAMIHLAPSG